VRGEWGKAFVFCITLELCILNSFKALTSAITRVSFVLGPSGWFAWLMTLVTVPIKTVACFWYKSFQYFGGVLISVSALYCSFVNFTFLIYVTSQRMA
jgi:hypothetical protein